VVYGRAVGWPRWPIGIRRAISTAKR